MPSLIVLGDKTSHGGTVVEASEVTDTHGRGIARVGDKVTCPKKGHGLTVIVTGDPSTIIDGKPVAYHGCRTSCGAVLLSSQAVSTTEFGTGEGTSRYGRSSAHPGDLLETLIECFDEQIRAVDQFTGQPLVGLSYFIQSSSGKSYFGHTNEDGLCERVNTPSPDDLHVWFGEEAEARIEAR